MKEQTTPVRSAGRFRNMTWGKRKQPDKLRKRYYFYVEDTAFVENPKFPFTEQDTLMFEIQGNTIVISKGKRVTTVVPAE
jgi:hypothetical protein